MATTNKRLRTYWADRESDRQRLVYLATRYWEIGLFVALIGLALGLRLWDLGGRAVHHDESIHMWYSWLLAEGRGYTHDPTYHGPFQIVGTAVIFKFGDLFRIPWLSAGDFSGRLFPALFGTALVGLPFFMRDFLGRKGALIAAGLLALSPVLLYFSRFARNDIYIAVFTLGMAIVIWRYMKEQKNIYLFALPLLLTLSFATKEVTYITAAIFLVYLEFQLATDLVDQLRASRSMRPQDIALAYVVLLPTAWLVAAVWPLLEGPRRRWSLATLPPSGALLVVMGTFALPQFAAGVQRIPLGAFADGGYMGEQTLMMATVFLALIATAYVGLLWNPRVWAISAAIFYVPFFLLFTTFFTNGGDIWNVTGGAFWSGEGGFWTGIWGSLDYWLGQQSIARGGQPDYYYFMFLPIYEFLPLVFALGGALFYAFRGKLEQQLVAASGLLMILAFSLLPESFPLIGQYHIQLTFLIAITTVFLLPMEGFTKFLLFWVLAILLGVTMAGEKMPWLAVHLAVPLALLAARVLDDVLSSIGERIATSASQEEAPPAQGRGRQRQRPPEKRGFDLEPFVPLIIGAGLALVAAFIFQAAGPATGVSILAWLLALGALGAVVWIGVNVSWQVGGQAAAVALFAALLAFTVPAAGTAAFDEGDRGGAPPELLIYAQGSPDLSAIRDAIDERAEASGLGNDLKIVHDNSVNDWPWPWYLRDYNYGYIDFATNYVPEPGIVALVSLNNQSKIEPYLDKVASSEEYTHMWWFPEFYKGLDQPTGFLGDFFQGNYFSTWRGYFIDRVVPNATSSPDRIVYYFGDFESIEPVVTATPAAEGVLNLESQTIIGGPGEEEGTFAQPAGLALDSDGNLYVVDTLNHRVQIFAPDGTFIDAFGQMGSDQGEFWDPSEDDFSPDGPWGIEVDEDGNIYVADTWNHRIQKFDSDLEFVLEWGGGELFGPRDIAIDADGNILVVDTGNKRIIKYSPDGELLEEYGEAGTGPGQFDEPSSISVAPNGDIYVADFWNRRVQHFDPTFDFIDEFSVGTWGSRGVTDRAYIVALEDGTVVVTDPANGEILVFDASGTWQAAWRLFSEPAPSRPVGIVVDAEGQVYISDGLTSEVRRLPLSELLATPAP